MVAVCALTSQAAFALTSPSLEKAAIPAAQAERICPPRSLTVTAGGDILAESSVREAAAEAGLTSGSRYDFTPIFSGVRAVIEDSDLAICRMELPTGRPDQSPGVYGRSPFGGYLLLAPYELAAGVGANAFARCSTASNHSYHLGAPGVVSTLEALDAAGISHVGTARSLSEAAPSVFSVKGIDLVVHHGPHVVQPFPRNAQGTNSHRPRLCNSANRGAGMAQPFTVGVCTDPRTRLVRAARLALSDPGPGVTDQERIELEQCLARTEWVVGSVL
jgi:hypothetical protein